MIIRDHPDGLVAYLQPSPWELGTGLGGVGGVST